MMEQAQFASVSRETWDRLTEFERLVAKWNPRINLVSRNDLRDLRTRHTIDSLQLVDHATEQPAKWTDLGSGGGFPGMVVAIAAQELHPATKFCLIESDRRKATFLATAARELELTNTKLTARRIEDTDPQHSAVVSSRALAPLPKLLGYVSRHLRPDGIALLAKGESASQEIEEARKLWHFDHDLRPSVTDPASYILRISNIGPRSV